MTATKTSPPPLKRPKDKALEAPFEKTASQILRNISGSDYIGLAARLNKMGVEITARGLENKISRGNFSTVFLLQCMEALKIQTIEVPK